MNNVYLPAILLAALCIAFLFYVDSSVGQLPESVATHFGASGRADGWMTRPGYRTFVCWFGVGLPLFLLAMGYVCRWIPWLLNIPNRQYWLAPERRHETFSFVLVAEVWLACLMVLFLAGIHYFTIQANTFTPPHLPMDQVWVLLGCFLAGTAVWLIVLLRHFRRPV
jgi:hypothetical protein